MTNATKNYNSVDSSSRPKVFKIDFTQSRADFKVSGLANSIFCKKFRDLSARHLGSPTYLLPNQEDTIIKKMLKISGLFFGISPTFLIMVCLYDVLKDLYYQHIQKYSRTEECSDENPELLRVNLLKEQSSKMAEVCEELSTVTTDTPQDEAPSTPPMEQSKELHNAAIEDSSETINEEEANNSFEIISISPELLEEIKNTPESTSRERSLWKKLSILNPFRSKTWNVITPPDATLNAQPKEASYKDFEMLDPIIIDHKDTEISTTKESLIQLAKDLPRNDIFINNKKFHSLQEFTDCFNIHLNENKTDILPDYHSIIPKIFDYSTQTAGNFGFEKFGKYNIDKYSDSLMAMSSSKNMKVHITPTSHINWDSKFPEKAEVIYESVIILFNPNDSITHTSKPLAAYKLSVKTNIHQTEITWKIIEEEAPTESQKFPELKHLEIEDDFEMIDSSEATKKTEQSDDDFTMLEPPISTGSDDDFEDLEIPDNIEDNVVSNQDIAFDHLLHKTNSGLTSTVTSEYLNSLKVKYPHFAFNDRLMFPGSVTIDEIANSLNELKNDNSNQVIFLPFLVNGWSIDHAVVAVINISNQTIEYFDPKGQPYFNCFTRTEKQSNKKVFDFLTEIGQKVIDLTFSKNNILCNKKNIPQGLTDNINCGAFCLQFIEERINHSLDSIETGITGRITDPKQLRQQLANRLIENTYSSLV